MRKKNFFQYGRCSPSTAKIAKNVLLLQGHEVFVYYLRTSAMCRSAFRVRETKRFKTVLYIYQYRYTVSWTDVNGKLVRAMGRHGFIVYFPRKTFWWFGMQLPLRIRPFAMAAEEKVASALNKLADQAFLDVLSPRDKSCMVNLMADFSRRIHKRTRGQRGRRGAW